MLIRVIVSVWFLFFISILQSYSLSLSFSLARLLSLVSLAVVSWCSLSGSIFVTFVCSKTTATDSVMAFGGHGTCSVSEKSMKLPTLFVTTTCGFVLLTTTSAMERYPVQ